MHGVNVILYEEKSRPCQFRLKTLNMRKVEAAVLVLSYSFSISSVSSEPRWECWVNITKHNSHPLLRSQYFTFNEFHITSHHSRRMSLICHNHWVQFEWVGRWSFHFNFDIKHYINRFKINNLLGGNPIIGFIALHCPLASQLGWK